MACITCTNLTVFIEVLKLNGKCVILLDRQYLIDELWIGDPATVVQQASSKGDVRLQGVWMVIIVLPLLGIH